MIYQFIKLEAAILAARSFSIESGLDYGVYEKEDWKSGKTIYCSISNKESKKANDSDWKCLIGPNVLRTSENTNIPSHQF